MSIITFQMHFVRRTSRLLRDMSAIRSRRRRQVALKRVRLMLGMIRINVSLAVRRWATIKRIQSELKRQAAEDVAAEEEAQEENNVDDEEEEEDDNF